MSVQGKSQRPEENRDRRRSGIFLPIVIGLVVAVVGGLIVWQVQREHRIDLSVERTFLDRYNSLVTSGEQARDESYGMLTTDFQNAPGHSRAKYEEFWSTVRSVDLGDDLDRFNNSDNAFAFTLNYVYRDGHRDANRVIFRMSCSWFHSHVPFQRCSAGDIKTAEVALSKS